jgi:hypothetical protein
MWRCGRQMPTCHMPDGDSADGLNADRIPTAQGGQRWYPATIRSTLKRVS